MLILHNFFGLWLVAQRAEFHLHQLEDPCGCEALWSAHWSSSCVSTNPLQVQLMNQFRTFSKHLKNNKNKNIFFFKWCITVNVGFSCNAFPCNQQATWLAGPMAGGITTPQRSKTGPKPGSGVGKNTLTWWPSKARRRTTIWSLCCPPERRVRITG